MALATESINWEGEATPSAQMNNSKDSEFLTSRFGDPSLDLFIDRIKSERVFGESSVQYDLFTYLLENSLKNQTISEYSIAQDVLGKDDDFDPAIDSGVRSNISRLRKNIELFNAVNSKTFGYEIKFPKRSYQIELVKAVPESRETSNETNASRRKWRPTPLIFAVCVFIVGAMIWLVGFSNWATNNTWSTESVDNVEKIFPQIYAFVDEETLMPEDKISANILLRHVDSRMSSADLIHFVSEQDAEYGVRISFLSEEILVQLLDRSHKVLWSKNYPRPDDESNGPLGLVANQLVANSISDPESALTIAQLKAFETDPFKQSQYRCALDLLYRASGNFKIAEVYEKYSDYYGLIYCADVEAIEDRTEKASIYALMGRGNLQDYLYRKLSKPMQGTLDTAHKHYTDNPLSEAEKNYDKAKELAPNLSLYLSTRILFEQVRPQKDKEEFYRVLDMQSRTLNNDINSKISRAYIYGYSLNDWDHAQELFVEAFGNDPVSISDHGDNRDGNKYEDINIMAHIMSGNYAAAYKSLEARGKIHGYQKTLPDILLYCLTDNIDGLSRIPDNVNRSKEYLEKVLELLNYHPDIKAKYHEITRQYACNFFE